MCLSVAFVFLIWRRGLFSFKIQNIQCAATICALLAFWASRKGYQYYKAKSDLGSTQAQNNPYFKSDGLSGTVPQN